MRQALLLRTTILADAPPEPSREDKDWAKTCMKGGDALGIKVLDFIILARDDDNVEKYYSFADHSLMSE